MKTPKQLLDELVPQIQGSGLSATAVKDMLINKWYDELPTVNYLEKVGEVAATQAVVLSQVDELWGMDEIDVSVNSISASSGDSEGGIQVPAHIADGLSRKQLERMKFTLGGGLVLTLLKPMLDKKAIKITTEGGFMYRGRTYRVLEVNEVVNWPLILGNLYLVVNCGG